MKKNLLGMASAVVALGTSPGSVNAQDADVLSGDTRLACEAILCLSTGQRPSECTPSLDHYFGIKKKKLSDTLEARLSFLNKCPVANQTPQMSTLVRVISRSAGRCDAASLNSALQMWTSGDGGEIYIGNRMPDYCMAYTAHAYTDFSQTKPMYVGMPENGGYWVEAKDYERALAEYNARLEAEHRNYWWGGS
ncbi:TrbM protein of DNA transfer system (plasmid) [Aromatoleum aromaticum EbN1]|uniref:TrbM protein of DNA transfer system n=1 Tax=Aromatoleum aromaticum (strain DSM 19018 / LMG 30748 / EbN1) TaxID=76114 RepID=Q5NWL5_AROAE|nr:TrbM/KikA/MpfK family conjugal transfer protein [Aromatoleum aromaticum]CAI10549.1 TrbM protein of DNA transfer system [Aromatoleum aromaticum EbN1]